MTFLEKLKQDHPDIKFGNKLSEVYGAGCPHHYNYEKEYSCIGVKCTDCWNREMPEEKETYSHEEVKEMLGINEASNDIFKNETSPKLFELQPTFNNREYNSIKDSGDRTQFATGAVRDMHEGKGRCDLLPLDVVGNILSNPTLTYIYLFQENGDTRNLEQALTISGVFHDAYTYYLETAVHFEDGAKKYGEYNWQKGIPVNCYIDSAVRHYLKYLRGDEDERHDRAFVWNILCCVWTCKNKPELNTYLKEKENGN